MQHGFKRCCTLEVRNQTIKQHNECSRSKWVNALNVNGWCNHFRTWCCMHGDRYQECIHLQCCRWGAPTPAQTPHLQGAAQPLIFCQPPQKLAEADEVILGASNCHLASLVPAFWYLGKPLLAARGHLGGPREQPKRL